MKINDIDYDYYQQLVKKADATDDILRQKFVRVDWYSGIYAHLSETELILAFERANNRTEFYRDCISNFCHSVKMDFGDFTSKYGKDSKHNGA
jgi:hypothetical protein